MANDDIGHFKVVLEAEVSKDIGESLEKGFKDSSEKVGKNLKSEIEKSIDKSIKKSREFERAFKVPSFGDIGEKLTKVVGSGLKSAIASSIAYISSKPIKAKIEADISTIGPYNDPKSGGLAPPEDRSSGMLAMVGKLSALVGIAVFIYDILKGLAPLVGLIKMIGAILQITLYPIANFLLVVFKPILGIILKYLVLPFYYWIEKFNAWWTQIFGDDSKKTEADKAVETTAIVAGGAIGAAIGAPAGPFGMLIGAMLGAFTGWILANMGRLIGEWLAKTIPTLTWDDILPKWDWENSPLNKWLDKTFSGITWDSLLPSWDWENSPLNKWLTENFSDLTWENIIAKFDWVDSISTYWEKLKWSDFISAFDWVDSISTYWEKLKWSAFITVFDWLNAAALYWEKLKWSSYITVFDWVSSLTTYWEKLKWSDFIPQFTWPEFKWPTLDTIKAWLGLGAPTREMAISAATDFFSGGTTTREQATKIMSDYLSGTGGFKFEWPKMPSDLDMENWIREGIGLPPRSVTPTPTTTLPPIGAEPPRDYVEVTEYRFDRYNRNNSSLGKYYYDYTDVFGNKQTQITGSNIPIVHGNIPDIDALMTYIRGAVGMKVKYQGAYYFQQGGIVPGIGNTDSVPAMLTPGETVLPVGNSLKNMIRSEMNRTFGFSLSNTAGVTVNGPLVSIDKVEKDVDIDNLIEKIERALYINIKRGGIR